MKKLSEFLKSKQEEAKTCKTVLHQSQSSCLEKVLSDKIEVSYYCLVNTWTKGCQVVEFKGEIRSKSATLVKHGTFLSKQLKVTHMKRSFIWTLGN